MNSEHYRVEILRNLIPKHRISNHHLVPWERFTSRTTTCVDCSCKAHTAAARKSQIVPVLPGDLEVARCNVNAKQTD